MERTSLPKVALLSLVIFLLTACGREALEEQVCAPGAVCSEAALNAPVADDSRDLASEDEVSEEEVLEEEMDLTGVALKMPAFEPSWGLNKDVYEKAVNYQRQSMASVAKPRYVTVIDFNQKSSKKRLYLFDLAKGTVERHLVAHGVGSDPNNDGLPTQFSNQENSLQSSLGFYVTLGTYQGGNGYSLRLRGLDSTNSNAESRAIVMHPAKYVNERKGTAGRSWGCPALDPRISRSVINKIKGGSILLIDR